MKNITEKLYIICC